jgi:hypothetical protein
VKFNCFTSGIDQKFGVTVYGFQSDDQKAQFESEVSKWCVSQFGYSSNNPYIKTWKRSFDTFYFMSESQRSWFLLKWS